MIKTIKKFVLILACLMSPSLKANVQDQPFLALAAATKIEKIGAELNVSFVSPCGFVPRGLFLRPDIQEHRFWVGVVGEQGKLPCLKIPQTRVYRSSYGKAFPDQTKFLKGIASPAEAMLRLYRLQSIKADSEKLFFQSSWKAPSCGHYVGHVFSTTRNKKVRMAVIQTMSSQASRLSEFCPVRDFTHIWGGIAVR